MEIQEHSSHYVWEWQIMTEPYILWNKPGITLRDGIGICCWSFFWVLIPFFHIFQLLTYPLDQILTSTQTTKIFVIIFSILPGKWFTASSNYFLLTWPEYSTFTEHCVRVRTHSGGGVTLVWALVCEVWPKKVRMLETIGWCFNMNAMRPTQVLSNSQLIFAFRDFLEHQLRLMCTAY